MEHLQQSMLFAELLSELKLKFQVVIASQLSFFNDQSMFM